MADIQLLKKALAIIKGIPEKRIDLGVVAKNDVTCVANDAHNCNTIACGMGWLGMHPDFQARGLGLNQDGILIVDGLPIPYYQAAADVFGITISDGVKLFAERRESDWASDKEVLIKRMTAFITREEAAKTQ